MRQIMLPNEDMTQRHHVDILKYPWFTTYHIMYNSFFVLWSQIANWIDSVKLSRAVETLCYIYIPSRTIKIFN